MKKSMKFEPVKEAPEEEYIDIRVPADTYHLFNAVMEREVGEPSERYRNHIKNTLNINKELYPIPDVYYDHGAPKGKLTSGILENSVFYPGTKHDYWVYVPAQYDENEPANLILLYDGQFFMEEFGGDGTDGKPSVTVMFDNLIAEKKIPVSVILLTSYGVPGPGQPIFGFEEGVVNRSVEYDTVTGRNAEFITQEFMPTVLKGLNISADPKDHAVCGMSSSGIAAFETAWFKNDCFRNVFMASPSFANIRHGIVWPYALRVLPKKDIKIFMSAGDHDVDNEFGNWRNGAYDLGCALHFADYEHRFYIQKAGHSMEFYRRMMPQGLTWLFTGEEASMEHTVLVDYSEVLD